MSQLARIARAHNALRLVLASGLPLHYAAIIFAIPNMAAAIRALHAHHAHPGKIHAENFLNPRRNRRIARIRNGLPNSPRRRHSQCSHVSP